MWGLMLLEHKLLGSVIFGNIHSLPVPCVGRHTLLLRCFGFRCVTFFV